MFIYPLNNNVIIKMSFFEKLILKSKKRGKSKEEIIEEALPIERENFIKIYNKKIIKNKVIVFLIPNKDYQDMLISITKSVADKVGNVLYISLNRPAEKIIEILKGDNIDTKKLFFVDAITKGFKSKVSKRGVMYISSPKNFDKFKNELNQILEKKFGCLIFDSLSTLPLYQDEHIIVRFIHDLVTKLIVAHESGIFICLSRDIDSNLIKDISMFADEVIDLKEGKEKGIDEKKQEKIQKLKTEFEAIRKAYASKFVSEQSYLKTKKRIGENIRKLRM